MMQTAHFDLAIVGGGIVGTAHAYHAARAGQRVALFERDERPVGATIRNFGMIWPVGQAEATVGRALRSRQHWVELSQAAGFWAPQSGSLHLAYHLDEWAVLEDFVARKGGNGAYQVSLLTPAQALAQSQAVNPKGLLGAMYSRTEVNVDPRQAIARIHDYLREQLGVAIYYGHGVQAIEYPALVVGQQRWQADRIIVASGQDFATLYPDWYAQAPIQKCKLQMMRTAAQPGNWQLGPNLAAGLTLQHYASFADSAALPALKARIQAELPLYNAHGIHVMMSQTALGELTIGDSHEYGHTLCPFDRDDINQLILDYLRTFAQAPDLRIAEYWHGVYPKLTNGGTEWVVSPEPGVTIVNGVGGAGMTLSFGLAEEVIAGMAK